MSRKGDRADKKTHPRSPRGGGDKDGGRRQRRADGGMRIVVPLQGVVQGRGGLVLGSLIPCALFYFLQLYIKCNRPPPGSPTSAAPPSTSPAGAAAAGPLSPIHRSLSRGLLSPRALPALSARGAVVRAGDEDSLYYAGLRRCADDSYHPASNPSGVIQLGLAENHLSLDLVREWMEEHAGPAMMPGGGDEENKL